MAVDTQRIMETAFIVDMIWSFPIVLTLTTVLLWFQLGEQQVFINERNVAQNGRLFYFLVLKSSSFICQGHKGIIYFKELPFLLAP
jgi:hypothetical protein